MGRTVADISLADLLPSSIKADAQVLAAARALDAELQSVAALADGVAVYAGLDKATEPLLSTLAWQLHVDHLEGWALAETDAQKRNLIRTSIEAHRHKGTRWAMERIFELLDMQGRVIPWFAPGEDGEPYTFRLDITAPDRGITDGFYATVEGLVDELKNVRSHLAGLTLATASKGALHVGAVTLCGETTAVYPPLETEIEAPGKLYMGAALAVYDIATVHPQEG